MSVRMRWGVPVDRSHGAVEVRPVVLADLVEIEQWRQNASRQGGREKHGVALQPAQDHVAHLAGDGMLEVELAVVLDVDREMTGRASPVDPVGGVETLTTSRCLRFGQHGWDVQQHGLDTETRSRRRPAGFPDYNAAATVNSADRPGPGSGESVQLIDVVGVGHVEDVHLQPQIVGELVFKHQVAGRVAGRQFDRRRVLAISARHQIMPPPTSRRSVSW